MKQLSKCKSLVGISAPLALCLTPLICSFKTCAWSLQQKVFVLFFFNNEVFIIIIMIIILPNDLLKVLSLKILIIFVFICFSLFSLSSPELSTQILKEVGQKIQSYPFDYRGAAILSGKEEGAYGWVTVNYLSENFIKVSKCVNVKISRNLQYYLWGD